MAGKKETTTKKSKKHISKVVVSDSEESDSCTKLNKPQTLSESESQVEESGGEEVEESEGENVKKNGGEKSKGKTSDKKDKSKGKRKGKEIEKDESESGVYKLPMSRISRIIKDENPDMRITHEATFLINKATEKFLELFAKEAFVCAFLDRKNLVAYNHLSSVVAKRSKLDFLSDFVPEKVKAEVALKKMTMNEK